MEHLFQLRSHLHQILNKIKMKTKWSKLFQSSTAYKICLVFVLTISIFLTMEEVQFITNAIERGKQRGGSKSIEQSSQNQKMTEKSEIVEQRKAEEEPLQKIDLDSSKEKRLKVIYFVTQHDQKSINKKKVVKNTAFFRSSKQCFA